MARGALLISEVLAAPKERYSSEWVELYNPGAGSVDLAGWLLDDATDGAGHPIGGGAIGPGELFVVELGRPILNNGGDTVRLLGPGGSLVDSVRFEDSEADRSLARELATGSWLVNAKPSPGVVSSENALAGPPEATPAPEALPAASTVRTTLPTTAPAVVAPGVARTTGPAPAAGDLRQSGGPGPAPTYGGTVGVRYALATQAPPAPEPSPAPIGPPAQSQPEYRPSPWLGAFGVALIVIACALLVADRKPVHPGGGRGGVL